MMLSLLRCEDGSALGGLVLPCFVSHLWVLWTAGGRCQGERYCSDEDTREDLEEEDPLTFLDGRDWPSPGILGASHP